MKKSENIIKNTNRFYIFTYLFSDVLIHLFAKIYNLFKTTVQICMGGGGGGVIQEAQPPRTIQKMENCYI